MTSGPPVMRRLKCPWCGRLVFADDATLSTHHEMPVCPEYLQAVEATDATCSGVSVRNPRTGQQEKPS